MKSFFTHRILPSIGILWIVSLLAFSMIHIVPGDPVTAIMGIGYNPDEAEILRKSYALDRNWFTQYAWWFKRALRGDLGTSITNGQSVFELVASHSWVTLQLSLLSFFLACLVGIPIGLFIGSRSNGSLKSFGRSIALIGMSLPNFWLGSLLILVFSFQLGWLPSSGYYGFQYLILPAIALAALVSGVLIQMTSKSLEASLKMPFTQMLRAKGLSERVVIWKHCLRLSLIPILTISGIQLAYLLGGSVVIEHLFALPGLGNLAIQSIQSRDYPVIQACILVAATAFIFINLCIDLIYRWIDPRLRSAS